MEIVEADERHIATIQQIYAVHVLEGCATFETEPPSENEMATRLNKLRAAGLPWFVAVDEGQVLGYCYLSFYRERYAYRFTKAFRGKPLPFRWGRKSEARASGLMRPVLLLNVFLNDFKWRTAHATSEVRRRPKRV